MNLFKIKATVITPVSIGNGHQLSPYKDYFIKDGFVHYIDTNKLGQLLAEDEELMDEYVEGVANMEGNRSKFDIYSFIKNNLKVNPKEITKRTLFYLGEKTNRKLYIQEITKAPIGYPYLPGSSIKGALKTAYLFEYLINDSQGRAIAIKLLKNPKHTSDIEQKLKEFEFAVSDSGAFNDDNLICIYDQRLHVKKGNYIIPTYREAIDIKGSSEFCINSTYKWDSFRQMVNHYAISGLETEKGIMIDADENERIDLGIYNHLYDFYEKMIDDINKNQKDVFLRVGFGKGFYMNSIAEAIFNQDRTDEKKEFKKYLKSIGYGKAYNSRAGRVVDYELDPYLFPITRNINTKSVRPLGWIKLEKIN